MTPRQSATSILTERTGNGPLKGILIADFSRVLAGPLATMLLADLGATVVKVEPPQGEDTRRWKPPVCEDDATYYLSINRNKLDIALDLANPEDLALAQELARRADVVVENFKPGGLNRFGLDYETVKATNDDVVYASVTGFGGHNPQPGYDLLVQGLSGFMSVTGHPDGSPTRGGVAVFDVMTGLFTTIGILAAIQHRTQTGEGQRVETNLMSSALSGLVNQSMAYVAGGVVPKRMGNEHPSLYPYQPMPTADGEIIVAVGNDAHFRILATVLDRLEWLDDNRFATAVPRNTYREQLAPLLVEALSHKTAQDWYELLSDAGLPCAPINTIKQGIELADKMGLEPVVYTTTGDRRIPTVRNPIRLSASPVTYDMAPPDLGQDDDLIRQWLENSASPSNEGAQDRAAQ